VFEINLVLNQRQNKVSIKLTYAKNDAAMAKE